MKIKYPPLVKYEEHEAKGENVNWEKGYNAGIEAVKKLNT